MGDAIRSETLLSPEYGWRDSQHVNRQRIDLYMLIDVIIKVYIDNDYLMTNIYSNNIYRSIRSVSGHIDPRETAVLICIYGYIRGVLHAIAIYNVAKHGEDTDLKISEGASTE